MSEETNVVVQNDDAAFNLIAGSTGFRRIQLFGSSNNIVKSGKFPMGHLGIVDGQEIIDLQAAFDCLVLSWRAKAIRTGDTMEINYDPNSEAFKKIARDSEIEDSGCMFGIEFLLYLPEHGFVPYFMNNKSSLYEAKPLKALMGKSATIKVVFIEGKKYSWHAPKVLPCSTPIDPMPSEQDVKDQIEKFKNPSAKMAEMAKEAEKNDRAR